MSAHLKDTYHIGRIGYWIAENGSQYWIERILGEAERKASDMNRMQLAGAIAYELAKLNATSVQTHYSDEDFSTLPGPAGYTEAEYLREACAKAMEFVIETYSTAEIGSAMGSLEYQSCEFEGWEDTPGGKLLRHGMDTCLSMLCSKYGPKGRNLREPERKPYGSKPVSLMSLVAG